MDNNPSSLSYEELKDFYLEFARVVNPYICTNNHNDSEVFSMLRKDLKRKIVTLCKFTQHAWDEGVLEIQTACGVYSLQENITKEERMQLNASVGKHLQFLTQLASSSSSFKKILTEYTRHYINVTYLLDKIHKDKESNDN